MILPQKAYEIIRWIVVIVLPALITLYGVIGTTFDLAYTQQIITIAIAVDTCLGTIFQISKINFDREQKFLEEIEGK